MRFTFGPLDRRHGHVSLSRGEIMSIRVLVLTTLLALSTLRAGERPRRSRHAVGGVCTGRPPGAASPVDEENRALQNHAESHNFYSSSEIQLDGDKAPTTTTVDSEAFQSACCGFSEWL